MLEAAVGAYRLCPLLKILPSEAAGELIKMAQIKWLQAPCWSSWAVALFGQLA